MVINLKSPGKGIVQRLLFSFQDLPFPVLQVLCRKAGLFSGWNSPPQGLALCPGLCEQVTEGQVQAGAGGDLPSVVSLELKLRARDDPQSQFSFTIFGSQVSFSLWYRNIKSRQALTSLKNVKLGGKNGKQQALFLDREVFNMEILLWCFFLSQNTQ